MRSPLSEIGGFLVGLNKSEVGEKGRVNIVVSDSVGGLGEEAGLLELSIVSEVAIGIFGLELEVASALAAGVDLAVHAAVHLHLGDLADHQESESDSEHMGSAGLEGLEADVASLGRSGVSYRLGRFMVWYL